MWQGKSKALTFSFDDGVLQDKKLVEILNKYNLKCTFNINAGMLYNECVWYPREDVPVVRMTPKECAKTFSGHEIAGHTLTHADLVGCDDNQLDRQIQGDRALIHDLFGVDIKTFAYPGGRWDARVDSAVKRAGLKYARTITNTHSFDIPKDFPTFNPTAHFQDENLSELAHDFINIRSDSSPKMFYIWGHSYECDLKEDGWENFEKLCAMLSGHDDIFYGTNDEVLSPFIA